MFEVNRKYLIVNCEGEGYGVYLGEAPNGYRFRDSLVPNIEFTIAQADIDNQVFTIYTADDVLHYAC